MNPTMMPVSMMTAGGAALIAFWLGLRTGRARMAAKVSIGDGGDEALIARMRAQANFTEYVPFIVILIGLIELTTGTSTWLWVAGALLLISRIVHALGMDGLKNGRNVGTGVTFLLMIGLGLYAATLPFWWAPDKARMIEVTPMPAQG
ncbi:MAG: MAPEG family protein [Pseudomonadota bacterium]|nr:MAPEG family protein [Pseudomonadota bacterium]